MTLRLPLLAVACLAASAAAFAPAPVYRDRTARNVLVGRWTVKFANGVEEACELKKDDTASVVEPNRSSVGKVQRKDGACVITFKDGRVERWSTTAGGVVVEHWFPASGYPSGTRVQGVASRVP